MIEVLTYNNIDDILDNPFDYVDYTQDIDLIRIDDVYIMLGVDEYNDLYFVVEDNEVSEDRYMDDFYPHMSPKDAYDSIVDELIKRRN